MSDPAPIGHFLDGKVTPGSSGRTGAVFNPATVMDNATYEEPGLPSSGFAHVLVNGVSIVRDGQFRADTYPGKSARAPLV